MPSPSLFSSANMSVQYFSTTAHYLIPSLSRNWNFYWDEGDNSCKCAQLAPRTRTWCKTIQRHKKVWSVKCCPLLCHVSRSTIRTFMTGWLRRTAQFAPLLQSRTRTNIKIPFIPVLWLSETLSSLLLKEMDVQYVNRANPIVEHMPRHLGGYNQTACARRCWFLYLPHVRANDSLWELELAVVVLQEPCLCHKLHLRLFKIFKLPCGRFKATETGISGVFWYSISSGVERSCLAYVANILYCTCWTWTDSTAKVETRFCRQLISAQMHLQHVVDEPTFSEFAPVHFITG